MANIKSSEKDIRRTEKRTAANKAVRSRLKTLTKTAREAVKGNDTDKAKAAVATTASAFDKAAKTGIVHKNKANRLKSQLAKAAAKTKAA
ncbi:MAG: 30S ribosomal protein S20 [Puniceicoccales bacterium]|jgi:small subunit ribosomal protein S20|nr:30S ribosomal protein S20 [Puniceicoccales bacterium]